MARRRKRRTSRPGAKLTPRAKRILVAIVVMTLLAGWAAWYFAPRKLPPIAVRVLYSETAGCSARERLLVAGVMQNRVGNRAFGNLPSIEEVCRQPGAFSCIDDSANANWRKTARPDRMSSNERRVWDECERVLAQDIPPAAGPSGAPLVYYHDRSITKPRSWDNSAWRAVLEVSTEHFLFYSIRAQ
jgi:hypothetical protein